MTKPYPKCVIKDKIITIPQNFIRNDKLKQARYYLKLEFEKNEYQVKGKNLAVLMLNPSEADINSGDPTVNKIIRGTHYKYQSIQIFNVSPVCETKSENIKLENENIFQKNIKKFIENYNNTDDILIATGDLLSKGVNNSPFKKEQLRRQLIRYYSKILYNISSDNIYILNHTNSIFGVHPSRVSVNFNTFRKSNNEKNWLN